MSVIKEDLGSLEGMLDDLRGALAQQKNWDARDVEFVLYGLLNALSTCVAASNGNGRHAKKAHVLIGNLTKMALQIKAGKLH